MRNKLAAPIDPGFEWTVESGFVWLTGVRVRLLQPEGEPERFIAPHFGTPGSRSYAPLVEHDALYRAFALDTEPTEEGITAFISQYGFLGGIARGTFKYKQPNGESVDVAGESLATWKQQIERLRELVLRHDSARTSDGGERTWWAGAGRPDEYPHEDELVKELVMDIREHAKNVRHAVALEVNIQIAISRLGFGVVPVLRMDDQAESGQMLFRPTNLLDAMWLQFSEAICADASFRRCKNCETWRRVRRLRGSTPARQYCSERCKMRARRAQGAEARDLHKKGRNESEIAAQLGMSLIAVRKALSESRARIG